MTDRDVLLANLKREAGDISPAETDGANYARGVRAVQGVVRSQGQVMSATLANNQLLYETNKELKSRLGEADGLVRALRIQIEQLTNKVEALQADLAQVEGSAPGVVELVETRARNVLLEQLNVDLKRTLTAQLYDELSPDQLKGKLDAMKAQAAELAADPTTLTEEQLIERGVKLSKEEQALADAELERLARH